MSGRSAPGLTKAEFEQLLARAAERHTKSGARDFTINELVEAGQELGIDALTVREVHLEHQRARERALARPPLRERPYDSILRLDLTNETFELSMPPRASTKVLAVLFTMCASALVGVCATLDVAPLALAGAAVVGAGISYLSLRESQTTRHLRLYRDGSGLLISRVGGRDKGRGTPLLAGQVHARLDFRTVQDKDHPRQIPFVALDHGTETHRLLEGYSHAERVWAVEQIEHWLGR
jgi:hypothetical protein